MTHPAQAFGPSAMSTPPAPPRFSHPAGLYYLSSCLSGFLLVVKHSTIPNIKYSFSTLLSTFIAHHDIVYGLLDHLYYLSGISYAFGPTLLPSKNFPHARLLILTRADRLLFLLISHFSSIDPCSFSPLPTFKKPVTIKSSWTRALGFKLLVVPTPYY